MDSDEDGNTEERHKGPERHMKTFFHQQLHGSLTVDFPALWSGEVGVSRSNSPFKAWRYVLSRLEGSRCLADFRWNHRDGERKPKQNSGARGPSI